MEGDEGGGRRRESGRDMGEGMPYRAESLEPSHLAIY